VVVPACNKVSAVSSSSSSSSLPPGELGSSGSSSSSDSPKPESSWSGSRSSSLVPSTDREGMLRNRARGRDDGFCVDIGICVGVGSVGRFNIGIGGGRVIEGDKRALPSSLMWKAEGGISFRRGTAGRRVEVLVADDDCGVGSRALENMLEGTEGEVTSVAGEVYVCGIGCGMFSSEGWVGCVVNLHVCRSSGRTTT
jgi:hypothetical protein